MTSFVVGEAQDRVALKYSKGIRDSDAEKFLAIASASNQMTSLTENLLLLTRTDRAIPLQKELLDLNVLLSCYLSGGGYS